MKHNTLTLTSAQKPDTDTYVCEASNLLGSVAAKTVLVVVGVPRFSQKPPARVEHLTGGTLKVNCSAVGDPKPVISWRKEGGQLPAGRTAVTDGSLSVTSLTEADAGVYVCVATSAGIATTETPVLVRVSGNTSLVVLNRNLVLILEPVPKIRHSQFIQGRSISNFPCSLTRNITSHSEELCFSSLTQMKDDYTTNSHYLTYTHLFNPFTPKTDHYQISPAASPEI